MNIEHHIGAPSCRSFPMRRFFSFTSFSSSAVRLVSAEDSSSCICNESIQREYFLESSAETYLRSVRSVLVFCQRLPMLAYHSIKERTIRLWYNNPSATYSVPNQSCPKERVQGMSLVIVPLRSKSRLPSKCQQGGRTGRRTL